MIVRLLRFASNLLKSLGKDIAPWSREFLGNKTQPVLQNYLTELGQSKTRSVPKFKHELVRCLNVGTVPAPKNSGAIITAVLNYAPLKVREQLPSVANKPTPISFSSAR